MKLLYFIIPALMLGYATGIYAQKDETDKTIELQETEVTASRIPIPQTKATRLIQMLTAKDIENSPAQSVNDLLKTIAGVDVRQRGGFGVQTDIGINGGNEDQLTVLLNGVNISNPQTGHLTMDLPVSINDIERIEVIEGGASRVYGASAFSGVINIVTKSQATNGISADINGGSYGTFGANGNINLHSGKFTNFISGGWTQSDGASANSDFKKGTAYWNEKFDNDYFSTTVQAGMSDMKYGANTFYGTGSNSQYEEDTKYLVSIQGENKGRIHVSPQLYWNRSYDHYIWLRDNPAAYENYHQTTVYGANVNAWTTWALGKTAIGVEYRNERILSTRLGKAIDSDRINKYPGYKYKDNRSNTGIYIEHDVLLDNWSLSAGVLANKNTSVVGSMKLYPGIDISYSPLAGMRIYASFNQSLRTPTFTDLYYNGPGIEGNVELKPEKSTDYSIGWSYNTNMMHFQVKGFYRKGTDMIDWVKEVGANKWTTANSDIDNIGGEAFASFDFTQATIRNPFLRSLTLSYCYNHQKRVNTEQTATYASQLVYLRNKFVVTLNHRIFSKLNAQWEFIYKERTGWFDNALTNARQSYGSFGQLDVKLQWADKNYTIYLQGNNLTAKKYYDVANVRQPGFWITAGAHVDIDW